MKSVAGRWRQLVGKTMAAWGRALNDRGKQAEGAAVELAGVIQEKSADAKQAAHATGYQVEAEPKPDIRQAVATAQPTTSNGDRDD